MAGGAVVCLVALCWAVVQKTRSRGELPSALSALRGRVAHYVLLERFSGVHRRRARREISSASNLGPLVPAAPAQLAVPTDVHAWMAHVEAMSDHLLGYGAEEEAEAVVHRHSYYKLSSRMARGGHGEVWRAFSSRAHRGTYAFVLKLVGSGEPHFRSGLRERYFGEALRDVQHTVRFVESLFTDAQGAVGATLDDDDGSPDASTNLWLVFEDAGTSLHDLIYEVHPSGGPEENWAEETVTAPRRTGRPPTWRRVQSVQDLFFFAPALQEKTSLDPSGLLSFERKKAAAGLPGHAREAALLLGLDAPSHSQPEAAAGPSPMGFEVGPSTFWYKMRTTVAGQEVLRQVVRQLLEGVAALHERGVVHRDIKPSNLVVRHEDGGLTLRLIDFGSALDIASLADPTLYPQGADPCEGETEGYQPPEVALADDAPMAVRTAAYDLWSVGVVLLELVLGTSDVFVPDARTRAIIGLTLGDEPAHVQHQAALAHAWLRMGIYHAGGRDHWSAAEEAQAKATFFRAVQQSNPLPAFGVPETLLDLIWQFLQFQPARRMRAADALHHAYLTARAGAEHLSVVPVGKRTSSASP